MAQCTLQTLYVINRMIQHHGFNKILLHSWYATIFFLFCLSSSVGASLQIGLYCIDIAVLICSRQKSCVFLANAGDKSPIHHIYLLLSFFYLWQTWFCSVLNQFMRSHPSLCKLQTDLGRSTHWFLFVRTPKAWLLSCGVTIWSTDPVLCFICSVNLGWVQKMRKPPAGRSAACVLSADVKMKWLQLDFLPLIIPVWCTADGEKRGRWRGGWGEESKG